MSDDPAERVRRITGNWASGPINPNIPHAGTFLTLPQRIAAETDPQLFTKALQDWEQRIQLTGARRHPSRGQYYYAGEPGLRGISDTDADKLLMESGIESPSRIRQAMQEAILRGAQRKEYIGKAHGKAGKKRGDRK